MTTAANPRSMDIGNGVTKSPRTLADGRDIIYYDAVSGHPRDAMDRRELHDAPADTELRHDPLLDQWVVVAGHRQARTFLPPSSECPLCPTRDGQLTEVPEADYDVAVFENRFPSLTQRSLGDGGNDEQMRPGFGRCEVVCFTSAHGSPLAKVSAGRIALVLEAWIDRDRELSSITGVEYVFIFENRGIEIGVTLSHPHGQIYAYPFVPPRDQKIRSSAQEHRERTGRNLFDDVIDQERRDGERMVYTGEHWSAFVPRAARWPFEVQMFTKRAISRLPELDADERREFATMYLCILQALDAVLGVEMPYIAAWHQAPVHAEDDDSRLFLEVFSLRRAAGKLKFLAGSESAAGVWINDIRPEDAASMLRDALARDAR
ncbi:MAG: galactose-1-phosphate uridylyltransferase [Candidatus Nanopelagicales bacterium]